MLCISISGSQFLSEISLWQEKELLYDFQSWLCLPPSQEPTSATTERRKEFCSASEAYPKSNTKPFFFKFKNQLQTQKWVPKNSPYLTRNGVVSSFLNPQWLEGKPQTSKQRQRQKLRKERQVPKESTRREERSVWSEGRKLQVPSGYHKAKKHVLVMFWGQFLSFSHQKLETIGNFFSFF